MLNMIFKSNILRKYAFLLEQKPETLIIIVIYHVLYCDKINRLYVMNIINFLFIFQQVSLGFF